MKIHFKAEMGPHISYRLDGHLYEVGDTFSVDEKRGADILADHPDAFEVVVEDPAPRPAKGKKSES